MLQKLLLAQASYSTHSILERRLLCGDTIVRQCLHSERPTDSSYAILRYLRHCKPLHLHLSWLHPDICSPASIGIQIRAVRIAK